MRQTLKRCGITPSNSTTYALAKINGCLEDSFGATPFVGCTNGTMNELWYYNYLRGKILGGKYEPTASTRNSSCPATGIKYPEK